MWEVKFLFIIYLDGACGCTLAQRGAKMARVENQSQSLAGPWPERFGHEGENWCVNKYLCLLDLSGLIEAASRESSRGVGRGIG